MKTETVQGGVDEGLLVGWLRARSVARGVPLPVADHGGWRVETGASNELRRYVFAASGPGLCALGEEIVTPRVYLKLCGTGHELLSVLPARWSLDQTRFVMTGAGFAASAARPVGLPAGYSLQVTSTGAVTEARILCGHEVAASGQAVEWDGVFIYDQIETAPAHRRRGLGSALMHALAGARRSGEARQVLIATAAGQALYTTLGWRTLSPYSTAFIPAGWT